MKEKMANRQQKQFSVLLIGDACLDIYEYGSIKRMSPEAPVPVFVSTKEETKGGMVLNVENNLKTLGIKCYTYHGKKCIKKRLIDERTNNQIIRLDNDITSDAFSFSHVKQKQFDAVVISDYNKGFVSYDLISDIEKNCNVPIFLDTKKQDLKRFKKSFVKINDIEYRSRISNCKNLIVTRGASAVEYKGKSFDVPKVKAFDVCGAGDTFFASLVYSYLSTKDIENAIKFAISASTVTIQHIGVYAPTLEEICKIQLDYKVE